MTAGPIIVGVGLIFAAGILLLLIADIVACVVSVMTGRDCGADDDQPLSPDDDTEGW